MAGTEAAPGRFSRAKFFPPRTDEAAAKFLGLFHRYTYILRPLTGAGWFSAQDDWKLSDTEILKAIAGANLKYFVGTRSGKASKYAVLDIDTHSPYHNKDGYKKIVALLGKAGIEEHNLYQSSDSGGWHIYIFFDAPVSSRDLYRQLQQLFMLHDFEVAKGKLEIFPNPGNKSLGQGLRLPLQDGFAWLNPDTLVAREERYGMSPTEALLKFVQDMECSVNPYHHFHKLRAYVERTAATRQIIVAKAAPKTTSGQVVPIRPQQPEQGNVEAISVVRKAFQKVPPGINCDTWVTGRHYFENGLTGPSQRAEAVFSLMHYLFYGDPERLISAMGYGYADERKWLVDEVIKKKHHGQSKDIASGRADALQQIERAASWVPPHKRGQEAQKYEAVVPISWVRKNANRATEAQKKIIAAVEDFREANMNFSTRDLSLKSGVSSRTIAKYPQLWKPAMDDIRSGRLETALHEYNAVEGAASQESLPPSSSPEKIMPSGRLAARRILYELKMRDARRSSEIKNTALRSEKAFDQQWHDRVEVLVKKAPTAASEGELRILMTLLARELIIAPTEEDCVWLSGYISSLKERALSQGQAVQLCIDRIASAS